MQDEMRAFIISVDIDGCLNIDTVIDNHVISSVKYYHTNSEFSIKTGSHDYLWLKGEINAKTSLLQKQEPK